MLKQFLLVGLGGGLGSMLRYAGNMFIGSKNFPLSTLLINIVGSFVIGLVVGAGLKNESLSGNWKLFLATGICGGFTTFSAFSLENMQLLQGEKYFHFVFYALGSVALGLAAAAIGYRLVQQA
jgi:fluoride exporter